MPPSSQSLDGQVMRIQKGDRRPIEVSLPLLGAHQLENAATAYGALKASRFQLSDDAIRQGFASVRWRARFELARREPPVIFDSAHNQDSFEKLRRGAG